MSLRLVVRQTLRESFRDREFPGIVLLFVFVFGAFSTLLGHTALPGEENFGASFAIFIYAVAVFVPMIGIVLGNDLVSGPREDGRLRLVLGQPISRLSVLLGGYVAKAVVLVVAIGAGGIAAVAAAAWQDAILQIDVFGRFVLLTIGLGLAYLGVSVAVSALLRTTDWTTFAMFSILLVFVLVWRFVPAGSVMVANGFEIPATEPAWVSLAKGFSPSVAYEYLIDTYVVEGTISGGPENFDHPLIYVGVLLWWIALLPALAYWRFSSTDL